MIADNFVALFACVLSSTFKVAVGSTDRQQVWNAGTSAVTSNSWRSGGEYIIKQANTVDKRGWLGGDEFVVGKPIATRSCATLSCENGKCREMGNGYAQCVCNPGFYISPTDRTKCIHSGCLLTGCKNGRCYREVDGKYKCQCLPGYQLAVLSKFVCEAKSTTSPQVSTCSVCINGRCVDLDGDGNTDFCHCNDGFRKDRSDPYKCVRAQTIISVCQRLGRGVCLNGQCVDIGPTYRCICNQGYTLSRNGKHCTRNSGQLMNMMFWYMFMDR
ncbi:latent-transforming growth factor beta-binding protein 2-like isoform X2 [Gigantopelta aegis]|uniref:latent-transforming growth factor beta-binding protein 2-like isoform X2 n=1 Tax=Gigantopelta aegis TaxID=1735272 RepID=UPI001B88CEEA|nr:latent-transforming growth factor beta-binding protein 2-like isoform X2 [Gigantopelta aegis]